MRFANCPSSVSCVATPEVFETFSKHQYLADKYRRMAKLLIVEDDESVRMFVGRALERAGHQIDVAADGAQGLDLITAASGFYDLVVSDIRMPEMDGIEMAKAAVGLFPTLKIILMTGYAEQRERAEELNGIILDVVQKPFSLAEIRSRVEAALSCSIRSAA